MDETPGKLTAERTEYGSLPEPEGYAGANDRGITSSEIEDERLREIRSRIERTEAELAETLNVLQEKLSYDHIMQEVGNKIREATKERIKAMAKNAGIDGRSIPNSIMGAMKNYPFTTALAGLGLSWLMAGKVRRGSNGRKMKSDEGHTVETGALPEDLYNSGLEEPMGSDYREGGRFQSGSRARKTIKSARKVLGGSSWSSGASKASSVFRERPLTFGFMALALGTAAAFMAPRVRSKWQERSERRQALEHKPSESVSGEAGMTGKEAPGVMEKLSHTPLPKTYGMETGDSPSGYSHMSSVSERELGSPSSRYQCTQG